MRRWLRWFFCRKVQEKPKAVNPVQARHEHYGLWPLREKSWGDTVLEMEDDLRNVRASIRFYEEAHMPGMPAGSPRMDYLRANVESLEHTILCVERQLALAKSGTCREAVAGGMRTCPSRRRPTSGGGLRAAPKRKVQT